MRTNIVLDDTLMNKALKIGGFKTKKATIENALRLFIQIKGQQKIKKLKGKIHWEGNLEEMRKD
ncbi:MAG: type II toxin-antitoxin system VapB family antitoxin [bacterium]